MRPISKILKFCRYHLYADNLQLYIITTVQFLLEAIQNFNDDLDTLYNMTNMIGLKINPTKSQAIIFGTPISLSKLNRNVIP